MYTYVHVYTQICTCIYDVKAGEFADLRRDEHHTYVYILYIYINTPTHTYIRIHMCTHTHTHKHKLLTL